MNPDFSKNLLIWILLSAAGYIVLQFVYPLDPLIQLLIALNVATFLMVVLDKMFASSRSRRVPEKALYLFTFLGGSIGMLFGMYYVRHKTRKTSFQLIVALLVLIQLALIVWILNPEILNVIT